MIAAPQPLDLEFEKRVEQGRCDQTLHAKKRFSCQHCGQNFPGSHLYFRAHRAGIDEVLGLVNQDQVGERCNRDLR